MQEIINSYINTKKLFEREILQMQKEDQKFAAEYPHAVRILDNKNIRRRILLQHLQAAYNLISALHPDIDMHLPDLPEHTHEHQNTQHSAPEEIHLTQEQLKEIYGINE